MSYDAVIIGAGHNGLVTGIYLARAGWKVLILERNAQAGGAVRTAEVTLPGFKHDLFAANLNLFASSPFYQEFRDELHAHGLAFARSARAFSSAYPDGDYLGVSSDLQATLDGIRRVSPHDAENWKVLLENFQRTAPYIFSLLSVAMPSWELVSGMYNGVQACGWDWLLETGRLIVSSSREFLESHFEHEKVKSLVAAWGMHLDFPPDAAGGALVCYLESMSDQLNGMALGQGGAANMINALVRLFESLGGELRLESEVVEVQVSNGRASGVKLAGGETITASKAVIANLTPAVLYGRVLNAAQLPNAFKRKVASYRYGPGTMMIHLALEALPGWLAGEELKQYAYVHVAPYLEDMSRAYTEALSGLLPESPLLVVGQPTAVDPSRAPDGKHVLWVMVRVVPGHISGDALGEIESRHWDEAKEPYADRIIDKIARYAPDLREQILARAVFSPIDLEQENPNLVGGDSVSGSHHLWQNYVFRPFPGWSRYKTPLQNLYMVGAGTWPGAGVGAGSGRLLGKMLASGEF
jgi:phytoene dehydrogenase-like protein